MHHQTDWDLKYFSMGVGALEGGQKKWVELGVTRYLLFSPLSWKFIFGGNNLSTSRCVADVTTW